MKKPRKRRGFSFGSLLMTLLTVVVVAGLGYVLPRLRGSTVVEIDTGRITQAIVSSVQGLPGQDLQEIPIQITTAAPTIVPPQQAAPQATPAPTEAPQVRKQISMTFGGSMILSEKVRKSVYYSEAKAYDFSEYLPLLAGNLHADLSMVFLDAMLRNTGKYSETTLPVETAELFPSAGINVVAAGFPNAFDAGPDGVASTCQALAENGVAAIGVYADEENASGITTHINGIQVTLLQFTDELSSAGKKKARTEDNIWSVPVIDETVIARDIARARAAGSDIIIVALHWGKVGSTKPTGAQEALAQKIADAGADIIIGAGSQIVQPVTILTGYGGNKTLCAWSLGTLLSSSTKTGRQAGMLLHVNASVENGRLSFDSLTYTPTYIWSYDQDGSTRYRVIHAAGTVPNGMGSKQADAMKDAAAQIESVQNDSVLTLMQ